MGLNKKEMASYGIGAVGKDMVICFVQVIFCIIIRIYLGLVR